MADTFVSCKQKSPLVYLGLICSNMVTSARSPLVNKRGVFLTID